MEAVLVAAAMVSDSPNAAADPVAATLFFVAGVIGGFVHGALVGVAGRPRAVPLSTAIRGIEFAAVAMIPVGVVAWGAALWISMTATSMASGRTTLMAATAVGWLVLLASLAWAAAEGAAGLRCAMVRWPERRPGVPLVLLVFVTLLIAFVLWQPELWFTDLRVSPLGAAFLALGATVWIALPLVVFVLHFLHQWHSGSSIWDGNGHLREGDSS
ncbi:MAG TPA: hypothetical protein VK858_21455 [Longimicrobiales bacterium]|nr:hypothetical protein [Longimicrobiales bacterium]